MIKKPFSKHDQLPYISHSMFHRPAMFFNIGMQVGSYQARPDGVLVTLFNYSRLSDEETLIEICRAMKASRQMADNDHSIAHCRGFYDEFRQFNIVPGIRKDNEIGQWETVRDTEDDYLTIISRVVNANDIDLCSHYITLQKHEQIVREKTLDIEAIVIKQVERGVSQGVQKAIGDGTATLKQIEDEKRSLQSKLKALEVVEQVAKEREDREQKRAEQVAKERAEKEARRSQKTTDGYVYLVKEVNGTHHKIGRTAQPDNRLKTFNVKLPYQVKYHHLIRTSDMYRLERELHTHFADKRVDGEWFTLTDDDIQYICSLQDVIYE
jgi:hypothetical protein